MLIGARPPWAHLSAEQRRFTLSDVRTGAAALPAPRPAGPAAPDARAAAVLVPVFERDGEAHLVLTKRPEWMPSHGGEIAFPGGKAHDGESLEGAALREAHEEVGLDPTAVEIVAQLHGLATMASVFSITPFVGLIEHLAPLRADPGEVDAVLEVPISELLADGVFREERWRIFDNDRSVYFFDLHGETVWGATARILTIFLRELVDVLHPLDV